MKPDASACTLGLEHVFINIGIRAGTLQDIRNVVHACCRYVHVLQINVLQLCGTYSGLTTASQQELCKGYILRPSGSTEV